MTPYNLIVKVGTLEMLISSRLRLWKFINAWLIFLIPPAKMRLSAASSKGRNRSTVEVDYFDFV